MPATVFLRLTLTVVLDPWLEVAPGQWLLLVASHVADCKIFLSGKDYTIVYICTSVGLSANCLITRRESVEAMNHLLPASFDSFWMAN